MSLAPGPFTRWPWLTRRRLLVLGIILGVCVTGIVWHHRESQRRFLRNIEVALPYSTAMTADAMSDWVRVQATYACALAAVAGAADTSGVTADVLHPMLTAAAAEGRYLEVALRPSLATDTTRPLRTIPASAADSVSVAEFHAAVHTPGASRQSVVLRVPISEESVSHFNIAADDDRTQRTLLVLDARETLSPRVLHADRRGGVHLLAVSHPGGGARRPATRSLPDGIDSAAIMRATYAWPAADSSRSHGIATGIMGTPVVYAAVRVPGTPWILVRERQVSEFMAILAPSLAVTDTVFIILTMLLLALVVLWWRARYQQRERDAMELRATFVAGVSHELRTPLTQVRMYAEMLRLDLLPDARERGRALQVIEKEAERLRLLIERALWFVRSGQAPGGGAVVGTVAVHEAVGRAVESMSAMATDRRITWKVTVDEALHVQLGADDLHQVLLNLLDNAVKYGPHGQTIAVTARPEGANVRLVVCDEGPGITPADEAVIWQPFRRGRQAEEGSTPGTGIGLAMVRDIVERAGGRAFVLRTPTSVPGAGAAIAIELPAAP